MKIVRFAVLFLLGAFPQAGFSQHEHMHQPDEEPMVMSSMLFPHAPMERDGSGTSWMPDISPMRAVHAQWGEWNTMMHGSIFLRYTNQDVSGSGSRGDSKLSAPNWFMFMASRSVGKQGKFMARGMVSFDRLTEGGNGYPLLFQTGETWEGVHLIDRQHPHDLFSELALAYSHSLSDDAGLFVYLAYPGEPALGPPAFMHRSSAMNNPDAPISHHWQDATHITFGVGTVGLQYENFKVDGSIFTGREPDENRFDFDKPRFDSWSGRITMNPTERTSLQVSHGFLKSPEALEPDLDIRRTTASLLYHVVTGEGGYWTTSLVWGANKPGSHELQNSFLLESDFQFAGGSLYGRAELVQKEGHELGVGSIGDQLAWTRSLTLGVQKDVAVLGTVDLSVGAQGTYYFVDKDLQMDYGSHPFSIGIFIQLKPMLMEMGAVNGHKH